MKRDFIAPMNTQSYDELLGLNYNNPHEKSTAIYSEEEPIKGKPWNMYIHNTDICIYSHTHSHTHTSLICQLQPQTALQGSQLMTVISTFDTNVTVNTQTCDSCNYSLNKSEKRPQLQLQMPFRKEDPHLSSPNNPTCFHQTHLHT